MSCVELCEQNLPIKYSIVMWGFKFLVRRRSADGVFKFAFPQGLLR